MTTVKIGLPTRHLARTLRRALSTAARMGADGVELDLRNEIQLADLTQTGIRQLRKLLEDAHLHLAAVRYPTRRGYDVATDLERRLQATCQAMQVAAKLGARVVVGRACERLPAQEDPHRKVLMQSLELLAREGNRLGARYCLLTADHPPTELAATVGELPEGTMAIAIDPATAVAAGYDMDELLGPLEQLIGYVVAGDAVREFGTARAEAVELGRGAVDWPQMIARLDALGYQGWTTIEYRGASNPESAYEDAVAYLRNLAM